MKHMILFTSETACKFTTINVNVVSGVISVNQIQNAEKFKKRAKE